jgi:hypothetical protein
MPVLEKSWWRKDFALSRHSVHDEVYARREHNTVLLRRQQLVDHGRKQGLASTHGLPRSSSSGEGVCIDIWTSLSQTATTAWVIRRALSTSLKRRGSMCRPASTRRLRLEQRCNEQVCSTLFIACDQHEHAYVRRKGAAAAIEESWANLKAGTKASSRSRRTTLSLSLTIGCWRASCKVFKAVACLDVCQ